MVLNSAASSITVPMLQAEIQRLSAIQGRNRVQQRQARLNSNASGSRKYVRVDVVSEELEDCKSAMLVVQAEVDQTLQ